MANKCFVLQEKLKFEYENRSIPQIKDEDDVLIRISKVGICGSDVHYWEHGQIGDFIVKNPIVLGHETSGVVEKCGKNVKKLSPGDRVALEPGIPCYKCRICLLGRYNLCKDMAFHATPPYNGTLCNYITHPAQFCFKLPDHVSLEEGAMLEPLSVALHSCNRSGLKIGDNVLIIGAGPIGLVNLLVAKARGAGKVIMVDILDSRLENAKSMGANLTIKMDPKKSIQEMTTFIRKELGDTEIDVVFECSGHCVELSLILLRPGGVLQCIGLARDYVNMPLFKSLAKEIDIRFTFRYANCYPSALSLVANGQVNLKPLVSRRFDLDHAEDAFKLALSGTAIKVIIDVGGDELPK